MERGEGEVHELAALAPEDYTEPELVYWEADIASGSSHLVVGLHGSRASVVAVRRDVEDLRRAERSVRQTGCHKAHECK